MSACAASRRSGLRARADVALCVPDTPAERICSAPDVSVAVVRRCYVVRVGIALTSILSGMDFRTWATTLPDDDTELFLSGLARYDRSDPDADIESYELSSVA